MSERIEQDFPQLTIGGYRVTSPAAKDYNCIAWVTGDTNRWWWPDRQNVYFWPSGVRREESIEAFIEAFEGVGYTVSSNPAHEDGLEKIALYVDSNGKPTHASKQLNSGLWSSKLGSLEDIEHAFDGLDGNTYGFTAVIMKRPRRV